MAYITERGNILQTGRRCVECRQRLDYDWDWTATGGAKQVQILPEGITLLPDPQGAFECPRCGMRYREESEDGRL